VLFSTYEAMSEYIRLVDANAVADWWSDQKLTDREREHISHPRCHLNLRQAPPAVQKTNRLSPVEQRNLQIQQKRIYTQGRTGGRRLRRWTVYEWRLRWRQTG